MTVAMLMENTLKAFYLQHSRRILAKVKPLAAELAAAVATAEGEGWAAAKAAIEAVAGEGEFPAALFGTLLYQMGLDAAGKADNEAFLRQIQL